MTASIPPPLFDPRQVPVMPSRVDELRAVVDPERLTATGLRRLFSELPVWTPELVREPRFGTRAPAKAAVLLPLVMHPRPTLLLTQRTVHLSTHSGQIALPGGKLDASDVDATAAALRETFEETGLPPERVEVLGTLPVYTTGTAFVVTPVVGLVEPGFVLRPNPQEVDDVFEVPLDFLMNPSNHRRHTLQWQGALREWYSMPYADTTLDDTQERYIWGATAGMLRNFYRLLIA